MADTNRRSKPKFESFDAVYSSGLFIEPSLLTALSLIFERIHLLNDLEFVIEFSEHYRFKHLPQQLRDWSKHLEIKPISPRTKKVINGQDDPFRTLNNEQRTTALKYLAVAQYFVIKYENLFGEVLYTKLLQDNETMSVKLIKKGAPGQLNRYRVSLKPLHVRIDELEELNDMVAQGIIPVMGTPHLEKGDARLQTFGSSAAYFASLLATRSLKLVLPQTKPASPEIILEARERLRDHLPPFWASMLSLAGTYRGLLNQNMSIAELERECDDIINTTVRPQLIELNQKMIKERRNWFYRIITPVVNGVKIMAAKPPTTTADIIATSISVGANVGLDIVRQSKALDAVSKQSGLTLLIELDKYIRDQ